MLGILLQVQPVSVSDSFKDTFNFLQGNGVYEDGIMHFLQAMKASIWGQYDTFIADAQALAAIFMIIFFSLKAYEMMSGDKQLEVMPLLRPFGLVMVILWWGTFTKVVAFPTDIIESKTSALFNGSETQLNDLRVQRAQLMVTVADSLMSMQAQTEVASNEATTWYGKAWESVTSTVKDGFSKIWNPIIELRNRLQVGLQLLVTSLLETLAIWILRICVYIIFFIQIIFSTILIILGPFSVAVSIMPAFRDSFTTWVARFIFVNLYSGIAYLILYISTQFQQFAMEAEITRFQQLLDTSGNSMEKLGWFASNGILSFGMVIITFLIGGLTMLTVPSISTWIVSTSGITSAASTMGRGASSLGATVTRLIAKI
jgi:hypothetical protein